MPLYDYQCTECENTFEVKLKMDDYKEPESQPCPECKKENTVKQVLVTAPALGDPIKLGIKRPDAGWNDVLNKVKKAHPLGHWANKKFSPTSGR